MVRHRKGKEVQAEAKAHMEAKLLLRPISAIAYALDFLSTVSSHGAADEPPWTGSLFGLISQQPHTGS